MLVVAAGQLRDPVALIVLMKACNRLLHSSTPNARASNEDTPPIAMVMHLHVRVSVVSLLIVLLSAVGASAQLVVATGRDTLRGLPA